MTDDKSNVTFVVCCAEFALRKRRVKMVEKFERLDRELAYSAVRLNIYRDRLKTPEGKIVDWDHIDHPGAAAVVAVTEEGKLLLVNQYRNSVDRITLEIPAGRRDSVEEPFIECASRELEEETGFRSEDLEFLVSINPEIAFCNERIDIFVARNLKPAKQHLDPDEFIDVKACALHELTDMIYAGKITDSKTMAAILAYKDKYGVRDA